MFVAPGSVWGGSIRRRIVLLLGGARSGKSDLALKLAGRGAGRRGYLATAEASDSEMAGRILRHQRGRGPAWETFETPLDLPQALKRLAPTHPILLIDCLTLWLSNLAGKFQDDKPVFERIDGLIDAFGSVKGRLMIVSNEVGLGIVPESFLGRRFRDLSGSMHQRVATAADEVHFVTAGLSMRLK